MWETQQEKTETRDQPVNKTGKDTKETIEQALQSKISDKPTLNKAKPIFEEAQKSFQEPINEYIKNLDTKYLKAIINTEFEPVKNLIEDIELTTGMTIIDVTKDKIENNQDILKEKNTLLEARTATKESYDKLDKKYQITDAQLQEEKKNIPQTLINQITEKTKDTDLKVDDYLKFYLTAQNDKEKNELQGTDFMKNYEELNDKLWILSEVPDNLPMMKMMSPIKTDLIVENNEEIKNYTQTSDRLDKISVPTLPESKDFDTDFDLYVKFIPDEKTREHIKDNKELIKKAKDELVKDPNNEEAKKTYEEYTKAISDVKENLPSKTQTIIKQRVMGSCITGLARYFNTTTIDKKNLADDFDINTQKGFSIEKWERQYDEEGDDVLYINGKINGSNIGFYYNLNNPDAQLKSDDFLHIDDKTDAFDFGPGKWGKNELGVKLPTLGMLSAQAQGVSEKNFTALLEKSANLEEFEAMFKQQVSDELLKNYGKEALVKTRVERDIEKNIATQTLYTAFIPDVVATGMNKESVNKTTKKQARELLDIRDKSTENMRSDELRRLISLTQRLNPLITQIGKNKQENLEPKRQKVFEDMRNERSAVNYDSQRGSKTLNFFKKFSKNDQLNLEDLNRFITSVEKKESISENMANFSPDFQTAEDHENADGLLENI